MPGKLREYRHRYLSPERLLDFFRQNSKGAAIIGVPPGLGKTHLIRNSFLPLQEIFNRVHYAASQHRILNEMKPHVQHLNRIFKIQRDSKLCGPRRDEDWRHLYRLNLSYIGKPIICGGCPNQDTCLWYEKDEDKGAYLILQTQDHLFKNLAELPTTALTILDELKFLELPIQKRADRIELEKYRRILLRHPKLENFILMTNALLSEKPIDPARLHDPQTDDEKKAIRKEYFKFLRQLSMQGVFNFSALILDQDRLKPQSRDQAFYYNDHPRIDGPLLITGYGADQKLLEHYFRRPFVDLTPTEQYVDPGSKFYQLDSTSTSYFKFIKNNRSREGIYRFVVAKIGANRRSNKKTLLVAKKGAIKIILDELPKRFSTDVRPKILPFSEATADQFDGINTIPLLHYGVEGINRFEDYDCVICMTAYNLKPAVIQEQLKQLGIGRDIEVDIRNKPGGLGREVSTDPPTPLAQSVFDYLERHKVLQTVSRARPFTTPTEVIFAGHQDFGATVFRDVRELANSLGVGAAESKIAKCQSLLAENLSQDEIAKRLKVSLRTVSRYVQKIKTEDQ
jgi:hypothetical protein